MFYFFSLAFFSYFYIVKSMIFARITIIALLVHYRNYLMELKKWLLRMK